MTLQTQAQVFRSLHTAPEILEMVNIWDAITAKVVSDHPKTRALATAGHGIAAAHGYADGEKIPLDLVISTLAEITSVTDLPVTADLDGGFGNAGETVRRAIGVGIVGANIEDQLRPLDESISVVRAALAAGTAEGIDFVLNARTDAFTRGADRSLDEKIADAIERGRAYIAEGATTVFVPGKLDRDTTEQLVAGIGERKVSVIGVPGSLTAKEYEALGVARITYGPWVQNVALTALKRLTESLYTGGVIPEDTEKLN
ncbi:MAG: isocitrate lyase/phosphoenolpyruvate mutase family protein [Microbacteriaceae bacterium]